MLDSQYLAQAEKDLSQWSVFHHQRRLDSDWRGFNLLLRTTYKTLSNVDTFYLVKGCDTRYEGVLKWRYLPSVFNATFAGKRRQKRAIFSGNQLLCPIR